MSDFLPNSLAQKSPTLDPDAIISGRDVITKDYTYFGAIPPATDSIPVTHTTFTEPSAQPGVSIVRCPADESPCSGFVAEPP